MMQSIQNFNQKNLSLNNNSIGFSSDKDLKFLTGKDVNKFKQSDVLIVVPHPDDETLFFGMIPQLIRKGKTVQLVYVTDGAAGLDYTNTDRIDLRSKRLNEVKKVLKVLGVNRNPIMLNLPDNQLRDFEISKDFRDSMRQIIKIVKPKTVYTFGPNGGTFHRDHIRSAEMTLDVIKDNNRSQEVQDDPSKKIDLQQVQLSDKSKKLFQDAMKPSKNSYWTFGLTAKTYNIKNDVPTLLKAIQVYKSQFSPIELEGFKKYFKANPVVEVIKPRTEAKTP